MIHEISTHKILHIHSKNKEKKTAALNKGRGFLVKAQIMSIGNMVDTCRSTNVDADIVFQIVGILFKINISKRHNYMLYRRLSLFPAGVEIRESLISSSGGNKRKSYFHPCWK